jgi:hypothetical protein
MSSADHCRRTLSRGGTCRPAASSQVTLSPSTTTSSSRRTHTEGTVSASAVMSLAAHVPLGSGTDGQWRAVRGQDDVRGRRRGHGERPPTPQPADGRHRGRPEEPRPRVLLLDEVRDDLGVHLGRELVTALQQFNPQIGRVVDDSFVYHGDGAGAITVRMRIGSGDATVGGPAGVADAGAQLGRRPLLCQAPGQFGDAPDGAGDLQFVAVHPGDRDAGRAVTPVFQAVECRHQEIGRPRVTTAGDNSAHVNLRRFVRRSGNGEGCRRRAAAKRQVTRCDRLKVWTSVAPGTLGTARRSRKELSHVTVNSSAGIR